MTVFCHGIAIPSEQHPCGWAWLDFDNIEDYDEDILIHKFESCDFNNGYGEDDYEGLTLKEILIKANGKFLFEINHYVDWEELEN